MLSGAAAAFVTTSNVAIREISLISSKRRSASFKFASLFSSFSLNIQICRIIAASSLSYGCILPIIAVQWFLKYLGQLFSHTKLTEYLIDEIIFHRFPDDGSQHLIRIHQVNRVKVLRHSIRDTLLY